MCKIISFFSHKGGIGKTTLVYNIGADLSIFKNKKVLVIDADSQMNLTASMFGLSDTTEYSDNNNTKWQAYLQKYLSLTEFFGYTPYDKKKEIFSFRKKFNALNKGNLFEQDNNFIKNEQYTFDLLRADINYFNYEMNLYEQLNRRYSNDNNVEYFREITSKLKELYKKYDFVLIDCSPSASSILNAFFVLTSNYLICPVRCDFFSYQAVGRIGTILQQWETLLSSCHSTQDYSCIDMKEKFIGLIVSETKKIVNKNITKSSKIWTENVNKNIKNNFLSTPIGRDRSITEDDFKSCFKDSTPYIITDKTCNYTPKLKDITDRAGIPIVLLTEDICKKIENNRLVEKGYKETFDKYKGAISFISEGLIKLK